MSTLSRSMSATPEVVWEVLSDGWLYPLFVVGAARMRDVDATWPAVGAQLHHSVGVWPALLDDTTEVLEMDEGSRLLLRARGWPAGSANVEMSLHPSGDATLVTIVEDVAAGPGLLVPKPLRDLQLRWRNTETLRRLAFIVERRP